jgi:L-threonylcarbamoyladenylate synthase
MMMAATLASEVLLGGGIIAYPTEGVFGLGCLPDDIDAVARILTIKERSPRKGLILIAAHPAQLDDWIDPAVRGALPKPDRRQPVTWIVKPSARVPVLVTGDNPGLAVRITTNPVAAAICVAVDMPIVSTSANVSGRPVARNRFILHRNFGHLVDYVVPGKCGPASGPSEIRELETGRVLRPGRS